MKTKLTNLLIAILSFRPGMAQTTNTAIIDASRIDKKLLFIALILIAFSASAQINFWENPSLVDEGKEPARAFFIPAGNLQEWENHNLSENSDIQLLNGTWKFRFADKVADRPVDYFNINTDESLYKDIQVPGSWETQGFGIPVYTNSNYIFPENPPFVDNNDLPIGTYRKKFTVDEKLKGKQVILHFGSIAGAATIYLNEKKIGYSKASKTPAEFNITPFLHPGENLLAVQIFKWSDASYLEDQDFWRLAGIERDVFLIGRPDLSLEDFFVVGDLDENYKNGILSMEVKIRNFSLVASEPSTAIVTMWNQQQKKIFSKTLKVSRINGKSTDKVSFSMNVANPEKWSAEYPNLYTLSIELKNNKGNILETTGCYTGFRKMEIKNKQLLINGKPIIIRGTNTHEHHEKYGRYVDPQTRLADIRLMKQHNLNAIRTSHYPQDPLLYELCDKYGIYIVDEANIEAHGLDGFDRKRHPSFNEEWKGQHLDRTIRMFERDKNHPCVITWSLGNESDFGPNYEATYTWLKENDKAHRPVVCNRARENKFTDIVSPMYSFPKSVENYALKAESYRPYILCEYAHSMGNSTGNFQEYWDIFMKYPILQGGFIWDWVDQGLETYNFEGKKYWFYGGDMGGYRWTNDENFCYNGLINADRKIHPALNEVKKVYQPIWFKAVDIEKGMVNIHNYNLFTDLNAYDFIWKLQENGAIISSDSFKVECKPLQEKTISLKLPVIDNKPGSEFFLIVEAHQRNATGLLEKGFVVANEQFAFPKNNYFISKPAQGNLLITKSDKEITFESGNVKGTFSLRSGKLTGYSIDGQDYLDNAPSPNFWRAPTDNDFGNDMPLRCNSWRAADNNMILQKVDVKDQNADGITIIADYRFLGFEIDYSVTYWIRNDGSIVITPQLNMGNLNLPELPRFGMKMEFPVALENITYYGRGPWENYSDRKTSTFIGQYQSKVADLGFDYSRPQENGYHTDVRFVSFTDTDGKGITIEGVDAPICFNAKNNYDEDFDPGLTKKQQHPIDVFKRNILCVNIDLNQSGVGGNNSWGALPLDKYRLLDKKYQYSFLIKPVK
jgi:beta-galactosidase